MQVIRIDDFSHWRSTCRRLIASGVVPQDVRLIDRRDPPGLFEDVDSPEAIESPVAKAKGISVPKPFLPLAENVGYHRDSARWNLLYRLLWRLTHGQPNLLEISTDDDLSAARQMEKQVTRDAHKAKAFVRFRCVAATDDLPNGEEHFIAWHQPDHYILRKIAPFFSRRFRAMNWTILTPDESVSWNQHQLRYHDGVPRSAAPKFDELEELWKTYYASIFNPARVKIRMMKSEMPVRYWKTLPEAEIIDDLIAAAPARAKQMIDRQEGYQTTALSLIKQLPESHRSPGNMRSLAAACEVCDLHRHATQTVFGVGSETASMVIVGEQPGDEEDVAGQPFVGPAGRLLRELMAEASIDTGEVYMTSVVKHFKFQLQESPRGKKRLHQRPSSREIRCCKPWLEAEIGWLRPDVLVCLGVTAMQAVLGRSAGKLSDLRGRIVSSEHAPRTIVSWHPAAILRQPNRDQQLKMRSELLTDLQLANELSRRVK